MRKAKIFPVAASLISILGIVACGSSSSGDADLSAGGPGDGTPSGGFLHEEAVAAFLTAALSGSPYVELEFLPQAGTQTCGNGGTRSVERYEDSAFDQAARVTLENCGDGFGTVDDGFYDVRTNELDRGEAGVIVDAVFGRNGEYLHSEIIFFDEEDPNASEEVLEDETQGTYKVTDLGGTRVEQSNVMFRTRGEGAIKVEAALDRNVQLDYQSGLIKFEIDMQVSSLLVPTNCLRDHDYTIRTTESHGFIQPGADPNEEGIGFSGGNTEIRNTNTGQTANITFTNKGLFQVNNGQSTRTFTIDQIESFCGVTQKNLIRK